MAYGYKHVSPSQLNNIVERLTSPTHASRSWRYDYDAQATHVSYLKQRDPLVHPRRSVNSSQMGSIVDRLTRPTTASAAASWDFDNQDANLLYLRKVDRNIRLPLKTMSPSTDLSSLRSHGTSSRRSRISIDELPDSGVWKVSGSPARGSPKPLHGNRPAATRTYRAESPSNSYHGNRGGKRDAFSEVANANMLTAT